jgi:hypothetical protein
VEIELNFATLPDVVLNRYVLLNQRYQTMPLLVVEDADDAFCHAIKSFTWRCSSSDSTGPGITLRSAALKVVVFRSPPLAVQRTIARWRGYRATYPQLLHSVLAPRT